MVSFFWWVSMYISLLLLYMFWSPGKNTRFMLYRCVENVFDASRNYIIFVGLQHCSDFLIDPDVFILWNRRVSTHRENSCLNDEIFVKWMCSRRVMNFCQTMTCLCYRQTCFDASKNREIKNLARNFFIDKKPPVLLFTPDSVIL